MTVAHDQAVAGAKVSWFGTFRSEWTKLFSIRSTYIIIFLAILFMVGLSFLIGLGISEGLSEGEFDGAEGALRLADTTWLSLQGIAFAQLAIGVFGVLAVSSEYSSGMVRATFAAVPRRYPVLIAKAALVAAISFVAMTPAAFASFYLVQNTLAAHDLDTRITEPEVLRAVIGAALYLAAIAPLGAALAWLLRSAAGAISVLVALLWVLPLVLPLVDLDWVQTIHAYLPSSAGQSIISISTQFSISDILSPDRISFGPWEGYAVMLGWVFVGLAAATVSLLRRDA